MTRTPKAKPAEPVWQQPTEPAGYEALIALAAEIASLSGNARVGQFPRIIRAIAEALK